MSCSLSRRAVSQNHRVHRLVTLAFTGAPPDGLVVNHRDGDKQNNTVANLEYVTPSENETHAVRWGLRASHERHGSAKLTDDKVAECRRRAAGGETYRSIAQDMPVHETTISKAVRGLIWR